MKILWSVFFAGFLVAGMAVEPMFWGWTPAPPPPPRQELPRVPTAEDCADSPRGCESVGEVGGMSVELRWGR